MLSKLPQKELFGGKVGKVADGIYHLLRGEVYNICEKRIFTFGGGSSHDKELRREGKNWWKEELPTKKEIEIARRRLSECEKHVDYIITHSAPTSLQNGLAPKYEKNILTDFLEEIKENVQYQKWFFGHYHKDEEVDSKHTAVFEKIHRIE